MTRQPSPNDIATAGTVLAKCAAYDPWWPRLDDDEQATATAIAWATTFAAYGLQRPDLLAAVDVIYRTRGAGTRILPADIAAEARVIRQQRTDREDADARARREAAIDAKLERLGIAEATEEPPATRRVEGQFSRRDGHTTSTSNPEVAGASFGTLKVR